MPPEVALHNKPAVHRLIESEGDQGLCWAYSQTVDVLWVCKVFQSCTAAVYSGLGATSYGSFTEYKQRRRVFFVFSLMHGSLKVKPCFVWVIYFLK